MLRRILCCILAAAPAVYSADKPNREIQELQRDVAQLQELIKLLQRSLEERIATLGTQVQGSVEAAGKATAAAGNVQRSVDRLAQDQAQKLATPVATLGGRMEQVSGALGTMQHGMADLTSVISKLEAKVEDLGMAVKVLQQPPKPPEAAGPPMSATDLWTNADRDKTSGKLDLALQGFADYLKWYGGSPQADDAQYYIGSIHFTQKDYEAAVKDFETLIEKYPTSARVAEALFYKGRALTALGRGEQAAESFKEFRKRFPNHALSRQVPAAGRGR